MSALDSVRQFLGRWIDDTTDALVAVLSKVSSARTVRLEETAAGTFVMQGNTIRGASAPAFRLEGDTLVADAGAKDAAAALRRSNVEIVLRPDRFLFRPLELPGRATEFLQGIIRSQIDRLTPWSPAEAAFGHTAATAASDGRIAVTVVATARSALAPWLRAAANAGAGSIKLCTRAPELAAEPICVLEQSAAALDRPRLRRILIIGALAAALTGTVILIATSFISDNLQAQQDDLARRIAERRAAMIAARGAAVSPAAAAQRALAKRKNETPSTVIALEALSRVLPDHTYVTEMRVEGDRIRITGLTRDAPSLIRLMEQSRHFGRATFFAPTTRGPNDASDRFHIETRLSPVFSAGL